MHRHQFIVAAFLVLLIALAGFRFISNDSGALSEQHLFASQTNLSATQRILLGHTIDINTADQQDLEALPLIGPVLAKRIIVDRERNGPFESVPDLMRVYGIGRAVIARNSPYIAVK